MSQPYDLLIFHSQNEDKRTGKYFGYSMFIHIALVTGSLFVVVPQMEHLKKDIITIELTDEAAPKTNPILLPQKISSTLPPKGENVPLTKGSQKPATAPMPAAPIHAETSDIVSGPVKKSKLSQSKMAKIKTHTGKGHSAVAKSSSSKAGVPNTLEDIQAPQLDFDSVEAAQVGSLGDNEFENEFKKIDHSNEALTKAHKAELDDQAKQISDESDAALKALADQNAEEARSMNDAMTQTRNKNAAALAKMRASEQAAAERAAKEAELAASRNQGHGLTPSTEGRGNGAVGSDQDIKSQTGIPQGIRSLDQLRQMPGNPRPAYSVQERRDRHQGHVVFYAYITTEGRPTQFRLAQTTGYRNLDGKTLAALKKWKFYPGQEGWVEIPFKWDIVGGVQEMPTLLRRVGTR